MRKTVLLIFVSIITIGMLLISPASHQKQFSNLLEDNVEALSKDEDGCSDTWRCYIELKKGFGCYRCANPCVWEKHKNPNTTKVSNAGLCE